MYAILTHGHFYCTGAKQIKVDIEAPFRENTKGDASMRTGRTHYQVEEEEGGLAQVVAYDKDEGRIGVCMVSAVGSKCFHRFLSLEDTSHLPAKVTVDVNEIIEK